MPDYTVKNIKHVTNAAEQFGLADNLEARFARKPLELEQLGISYQRLEPNFRIPFGHRHDKQEELYVVVNGSARVKLDDEVIELAQWDAIRVPGGVMRNFEAGPEGVEYLAIGAPPEDGAEMEQGWWAAD
jgi:mannose-6-phosphate isomerase-like protein (cupin superfamily)